MTKTLAIAFFSFGLLFTLFSCTRKPLKQRSESLRLIAAPGDITDDLSAESLLLAIDGQIRFWENADPSTALWFGERKVSGKEYEASLKDLRSFLQAAPDKAALQHKLTTQFDFYEVYGGERWGEVLLTSYFEPEISGALAPTPQYSQAIYATPSDLIEVATALFDERFFDVGAMRGRLVKEPGRKKERLLPYFSRKEIDTDGALKTRGLELAFADPIEVFFAQIQGSVTLRLPDGKLLALNYADQNGHRYQSIGTQLKNVIPLEQMSANRIEDHLRTLSPAKLSEILNKNPSYVFFQKREGAAKGSMGLDVTDGRTIAADGRFFPKGSLAYLSFEKPVFSDIETFTPERWDKVGRLVLDQDSGGAIRGGGRVDLFWGRGKPAKQAASIIKQKARLYYLAPKPSAAVQP